MELLKLMASQSVSQKWDIRSGACTLCTMLSNSSVSSRGVSVNSFNMLIVKASYFIFPETSKLSLEEIDAVFETPGVAPVKLSLDIQKAKMEKKKMDREAGII